MTDEIDAIWRDFLTETEEHLEIADALLSRGGGAFSRDDIATLFRAMHSLKGLSQAMDLMSMQAVAHNAEDLLSIVRDGRATLDEAKTTLLLDVVDQLRGMREWVETHRADPAPEPDLVARISRFTRVVTETAAVATTAATAEATPLTDDAEMLAIYCELLAERAPGFVDAIATGDGAATAEGADELVHGAELIGLDQLAGDLREIAGHARALDDDRTKPALLLALTRLRQQLALLEEFSGAPAGAEALARALEALGKHDAIARVVALRLALNSMDPQDRNQLSALIGVTAAARLALEAGGMPMSAATMLLVEEQISRAAQGEIVWTPAVALLAQDLVGNVEESEADLAPSRAAALHADWQARMRGDVPVSQPGGAPPGGRLGQALPAELRATLTDVQLAGLDRRVTDGLHVYDLLLDTENDADIAGDLAAWLSANTEVITTRTVNASGMSWFEFLFATRLGLEPVRDATSALDPDQRCLRGLREILADAGVAEGPGPARATAAVIRVRVDAVEALMDGLDEMRVMLGVLTEAFGALDHELAGLRAAFGSRSRGTEERLEAAKDIVQRVDAMHRRLRADCIELRVVLVDTVFARFPRVVRDLAQRLQREVEFEVSGQDVRLDKSMADLLIDPLMHLVRNALDHGIEAPAEREAVGKPRRARLMLGAAQHPDGIHISVRDDGRGLDRAAIHRRAVERGLAKPGVALSDREIYQLLFSSGFSTAAEVSEISGRGVGLDVVATTVGRIGGTIEIETMPGQGTCFTMRVPASASLQDVILVRAGELVALPERRVSAVIALETVERVGADRTVWYRDEPVPLHDLADLLGFAASGASEAAVLVADGDKLVGFAVERMPERREVFLKELHPILAGMPAVAGATLLSDGNAVLILDLEELLERCRARSA